MLILDYSGKKRKALVVMGVFHFKLLEKLFLPS